MKPHLILISALTGVAAFAAAPTLLAADVITSYPYPVPANSPYPSAESSRSTYAGTSNAVIVALNAQALMLKDLLHEHQTRAAELSQKDQTEKAKWETELADELQQKLARAQQSLDQMAQPGAEKVKSASGEADAQLLFMSTVEARLAQVRDDLSVTMADGRSLSQQVATNKAPESIAAISTYLTDNQKLVKELQREQLDLELRKLEFQALQKAIQK